MDSDVRKNKLSRRKKAKAKQTLNKAFMTVISEIENDVFLRNHLFLKKGANGNLAVGNYIIAKNKNGMFDIYKKNMKNLKHKDIMVFDAAMAIVESLNMNNKRGARQIIEVENEYAHNYMEMLHFKNAYKHSIKMKDDNADIFANRYIIAKYKAIDARDKLRGFRTAVK